MLDLNFTEKDLRELIENDAGFKRFLSALAGPDQANIKALTTDPSILQTALSLLPDSERSKLVEIIQQVLDSPQEALRLYQKSRFFEARELLLKTLLLFERQADTSYPALNEATDFVSKRLRSLCYNMLGDVELALGNFVKAGNCHRRAINLAEEIADVDTIVKARHGLGVHYYELGEFASAIESCETALELIAEEEDQWRTREKILTTLSVLYSETGQYETAFDHAYEAVGLCSRSGDFKTFSASLNNLACLHLEHGDLELAADTLREAADAARQTQDLRQEALILNNLAICFIRGSSSPDELRMAADFANDALSMSTETGAEGLQALSMNNLGLIHQACGSHPEARKAFLDAIKIYRGIGAKSSEAVALTNLGIHLRDYMGDRRGAVQASRAAVQIIEHIRGSFRKEAYRIGYAERASDPYELIVDCLLGLGDTPEALEYMEKAKSRALLDFLSSRLVDQAVLWPDSKFFQEALALLVEMDEIRKNMEGISRTEGIADSASEDTSERSRKTRSEMLLADFHENERVFERAFSELQTSRPDEAALIRAVPLSAESLHSLLNDGSVLLEIFQGESKLHFLLTSDTGPLHAFSVDLPFAHAEDLAWAAASAIRGTSSLDIRAHEFIREVRQPLAELYDMLIRPLRQFIRERRHLILSPHLFWHYFPFHALYDRKDKRYLCDQHEVTYCPSGSILQLCKEKDRLSRQSAVILANNTGDLPNADREADLVAEALSPFARVFKGDRADLDRITAIKEQTDIIHLACHGEFNHDQPFLSGIDILADTLQSRRVYLLDLFNLKLDCSLVTLSACESGLSRFTGADELIGLSRGLFYAGAASVLLSLWRVSDESTCYLMENFYWHYVKNNRTKARALQLAMQAVKAKPEYAHPYFWAPFVVTGDWR